MRSADLTIVSLRDVLMKSLIHCLIAVATAALLLVDAGSAAESVDTLVEKGKAFERKFQTNDALPLYLSAEKVEPKNPELLVRIARQYRYLMTDASDNQEKLRLGHIALDYSTRAAACGPKDCDAQLAPAITLGKMLPYLPTKEQVGRFSTDQGIGGQSACHRSAQRYRLACSWPMESRIGGRELGEAICGRGLFTASCQRDHTRRLSRQ